MLRTLESILRLRFPTIVLRGGSPEALSAGRPVFDAFFVPADRGTEFSEFTFHELQPLLDARGLPEVIVISHSVKNTREYFPEVAPRRTRSRRPVKPSRRRSRAGAAPRR